MSDPLTCNATGCASRNFSYERDEPNQCGGTTGSAPTPTTSAATPLPRQPEPRQRGSLPPGGSTGSHGSRALAARFATRPTLPSAAEREGECVSVGYLRVASAPPGASPDRVGVGLEDYVALESRAVTSDQDAHDLSHPTANPEPASSEGGRRRVDAPTLQAAPGPSYEETRRAQRVGVESGEASLIDPALLEVAGVLTENSTVGAPVSAAGPVSTLWALHQLYLRAHEDGTELRQATDRDAANLAIVLAGNQALPRTYVDATVHEYRISTPGAERILTAASRDPTSYRQLVENTELDIRHGREAARTAGLDSRAALETELRSDEAFRHSYQTNAGFRHGVRAEVMLAERGYRD